MIQKQKILVIDDDSLIRQLIHNTLQSHGYEVLSAATGIEGINTAKSELPDLILLDIMLPDLDGYEVCTRLRSLTTTSEIPLIMMTAADRPSDVIRGFVVGTDDYITKPFGVGELIARIKARLRRQKLSQS